MVAQKCVHQPLADPGHQVQRSVLDLVSVRRFLLNESHSSIASRKTRQ